MEMKRLRELIDSEFAEQREAAGLLAWIPPLERSAERKQRVWHGLLSKPSRQVRWLRPMLIVPAVCVATAAGASMTELGPEVAVLKQWVGLTDTDDAARANSTTEAASEILSKTPRNSEAPAPAEVNEVERVPAVSAKQRMSPKQSVRPPARAQKAVSDPEAVMMLQAMRARKSGDAVRAEQLASEYRKKYPRGALGEEALVLAFEAAASRKSGDAEKLARQYLVQFPDGRFRDRAHRVIAGANP
jgi:hypothetical protein